MSDFQLRKISIADQRRLAFAAEAKRELAEQVAATPVAAVDPLTELFGDPISVYTRRQAIEDGVLVQLSGDGYEGDEWIPQMVAEAGFRYPIAMTVKSFMDCVAVTKAAERACQDIQGRLWDVLWMLKQSATRKGGAADVITFVLHCSVDRVNPSRVELKAVCGPGDEGEPVITIMYPWED